MPHHVTGAFTSHRKFLDDKEYGEALDCLVKACSDLLLQSRAYDETGYVQPTKDELRAVRGENSIYHNNGIQTWHVMANGGVENVEIS